MLRRYHPTADLEYLSGGKTMKHLIVALALAALVACGQGNIESAEGLTQSAQEILNDGGRDLFDPEAFALLERAVESDPNYLPARQERLHLYLAKRRLSEAVEEAREISRIQGDIPEALLMFCMLEDLHHGGARDGDTCYKKVAASIESRTEAPESDLNYLLALKLSDSPVFQSAAEAHIRGLEREDVRSLNTQLLYELDRTELLEMYFPGTDPK